MPFAAAALDFPRCREPLAGAMQSPPGGGRGSRGSPPSPGAVTITQTLHNMTFFFFFLNAVLPPQFLAEIKLIRASARVCISILIDIHRDRDCPSPCSGQRSVANAVRVSMRSPHSLPSQGEALLVLALGALDPGALWGLSAGLGLFSPGVGPLHAS